MGKKLIIPIFLFAFSFTTYSQSVDEIAFKYFKTLNQLDSLGQKQGEWTHYRMYVWERYGIGQVILDTIYYGFSNGVYLDDNKIGKWVYYTDEGCAFWINKVVEYKHDNSILEIIPDVATTEYSMDSSLVKSLVFAKREDTVLVHCIDKKMCEATYQGQLLKKFDYKMFDFEKEWIAWGDYTREINQIKERNSR